MTRPMRTNLSIFAPEAEAIRLGLCPLKRALGTS
jgi:hypothetical protein